MAYRVGPGRHFVFTVKMEAKIPPDSPTKRLSKGTKRFLGSGLNTFRTSWARGLDVRFTTVVDKSTTEHSWHWLPHVNGYE